MGQITAAEQLMIELLNRARLDPSGEAARFGIDLNEGLALGTIGPAAQQVLAPNAFLNAAAAGHSQWMLDSASHRVNILQNNFREVGVGQVEGRFQLGGTVYNSSMLTQNFAYSGSAVFLTGVAYADANANGFYDIGEGVAGIGFRIGAASTVSAAAGGYAVATSAGMREVEVLYAGGRSVTGRRISRAETSSWTRWGATCC